MTLGNDPTTKSSFYLKLNQMTKITKLPHDLFLFRRKTKTLNYLALAKIVKITKLPDDLNDFI